MLDLGFSSKINGVSRPARKCDHNFDYFLKANGNYQAHD